MHGFLAVALKELRLLARDRAFLVLELVVPVLLLVVFGTVFSVTLRDAPVAVADRDGTPASRALVAALRRSATFLPETGDGGRALDAGRAVAAIEILPGFARGAAGPAGEPRAGIRIDGSDGAARAAVAALIATLAGGADGGPATVTWYNPERRDALFFVPGVVALILFAGAAIFPALSLAREKESRAWATLSAMPVSDGALLAGKLLPYLAQTAVIAAACLGIAHAGFGVPCRGPVTVLALGTGLFLVASVALGAALAAVCADENATWRALQLVVLLPGFVLSGFVYPLASMPPVAAALSHLLPARSYLELLRAVLLKGAGAAEVSGQLGALAGFAGAGLAVAALLLRRARQAAA